MKQYLAFDLGASSGRAILGTIDNGKVTLEEMHRFENGPMSINGGLFWNLLGLFNEMKLGLKKTLEAGANLSAIAIDTQGPRRHPRRLDQPFQLRRFRRRALPHSAIHRG